MNISLTQENLSQALGNTSRIAGSRSTLPVLANVLLKTDGNRLKVSSTNLEIGVNNWIGAKVEKPGAITVPAKLFHEYIQNLPSQIIKLSVEKNILQIKTKGFEGRINGIDAEEFPTIPTVSSKQSIKLPAQELKAALTQVVGVASLDDGRPVLNGVYFYIEGDQLVLVATDSYRLAEKKLKIPAAPKNDFKTIIPARSVQELLRMVDDQTETVELLGDESQALFRFGETELITRLIDGQFPDYRQLIPSSSLTTAIVNCEEFNQVSKVAALFARESASSVTLGLSLKTKQLELKSISSQVGDNVATASANIKGEDASISLNCRYILDALAAIKSPQISLEVTGKLNPFLLKPIDDTSYLHIIMPLKS